MIKSIKIHIIYNVIYFCIIILICLIKNSPPTIDTDKLQKLCNKYTEYGYFCGQQDALTNNYRIAYVTNIVTTTNKEWIWIKSP